MSDTKKVAVLVDVAFQDEEATEPAEFLRDLGAEVVYVGPEKTAYKGKYDRRDVAVDKAFEEVRAEEFDAVIIPGGSAPEHLRVKEAPVKFIKEFANLERPIAAICHGPQLLITADLLRGRTITCYEGIRDDVKLAGANYLDETVVVDQNFITSRKPEDIPEFNAALALALGLATKAA
jgi:protease I